MPKYARQRNAYSCGPVAIINAAKYFGLPLSMRSDLGWLMQSCKTNNEGTSVTEMRKTLQDVLGEFLKIKTDHDPSVRSISSFLSNPDSCVLLGYAFIGDDSGEEMAHWTVITDKLPRGAFEFINAEETTFARMSANDMKHILDHVSGLFPVAFYLTER